MARLMARMMAPRRALLGLLSTTLLFLACRKDPPPPAAQAAGGTRHSPLSLAERPTTDASIALGNLDAQIDGAEAAAENPRFARVALVELITKLGLRGQVRGRITDYERADAKAELLVRMAPQLPESYLERAGTRATLHRFAEALADVDEAVRRGARGPRVERLQASIYQATGRLDEALELCQRHSAKRQHISTLSAEASVRADRGETDAAEELFIEAQYHFPDVSPFTLASLYLQEGLMWQRQGRLGRARELFSAALDRVPDDAPARSHLAAVEAQLGARDRAIGLLRPLLATSDDPEVAGQLAALYREAGQMAEAERLRAKAAARFDELIAAHPAAFANHAARFWLGPGGDPRKALQLARVHLTNAPTTEAYELVLESALAVPTAAPTDAGDAGGGAADADPVALGCRLGEQALALRYPSVHLRALLVRVFTRCGDKERADQVTRLLAGSSGR
jgi:tetratricopeptide (TPR) repeat protein